MPGRNKLATLSKTDICAVIVTYHPDDNFPERLAAIKEQVDRVIIVDNGSKDNAVSMLHRVAQDNSITLVLNNDNFGIATALNTGIYQSESLGYQWSLLLDQDSSVDSELIQSLCAVHTNCGYQHKIAVIGSGYRDIRKPVLDTTKETAPDKNDAWQEVERVITSGSLLSIERYKKLGGFREDYFIDLVDTEYCMRARKHGYHVIKTSKPLMSHSIGIPSRHKLWGKTKWTTNHSADRRYYYIRNYTVLHKEYTNKIVGWWMIKGLLRCIKLIKLVLFFESDKLSKTLAIVQGWWHGVIGKMGKRNN